MLIKITNKYMEKFGKFLFISKIDDKFAIVKKAKVVFLMSYLPNI